MQSGNKSMIVSAVFRVILLQARLALKFSFQGPSGERCTAVVVFVRWPSRWWQNTSVTITSALCYYCGGHLNILHRGLACSKELAAVASGCPVKCPYYTFRCINCPLVGSCRAVFYEPMFVSRNSTVVSVCRVSFDLAWLFSSSVAFEKNSVAHHSVKVRQCETNQSWQTNRDKPIV